MKNLIFCFLFLSCAHHSSTKNHIMFVVDGMGPAHITGARLFKGGPEARLAIENMPYTGIVRTASTNDFVTDSAASATAFATGVKTYNRSIGLSDPRLETSGEARELNSILSAAKAAGKSVGIVSSTRITHATPAAYFARVPHRNMEEEIANQLLAAKVDLIIAGGASYFKPQSLGGKRKDQLNLFDQFKAAGYQILSTDKEIFESSSPQPILALLNDDHLPYDLERKENLELKDYVDFAIKYLSKNPNGYFLVVEAGRVDHASHLNQVRLALGDMLAMDRAVERALDEKKNTLIVVTADHETGGLALNGYAPHDAVTGERLFKNHKRDLVQEKFNHGFISWGSGPGFHSPIRVDESVLDFQHKATYETPIAYHTAVDVPVMAAGPGAEIFTGFHSIEQIVALSAKILGLDLNNE